MHELCRSRIKSWKLAIWLLSLLCGFLHGISTNGDPNNENYIVQPAEYPYFVSLFERGDCAGSIISTRHVVTAAHCLCGVSAAEVQTILSDGSSVYPTAFYFNPDCLFSCQNDGPNRCDVAVLEYAQDVAGASVPVSVYRWDDEVGKTLMILGYGKNGNAATGSCNADTDGQFRRAENIVTAAEGTPGGVVKYVMDNPGLTLEGMAQDGDSGGPAIIQRDGVNYVAGVNSGTSESNPCDYGSVDQYCRLSSHYSFIVGIVGDAPHGTTGTGTAAVTSSTGQASTGTSSPRPAANSDEAFENTIWGAMLILLNFIILS